MFFPLSYLFGDILTEVYGYARSRKVIWAGFSALIFATIMTWVILALPPAPHWPHQQAWETVFSNSWRIVAASLTAFLVGEWVNSVVLAKMKIMTGGRYLWSRTIGSTIAGEAGRLALIFYPLAFLGVWETSLVVSVMLSQLRAEGRHRGRAHAAHLPGRRLPEASRARRLLRHRHEFQSAPRQ